MREYCFYPFLFWVLLLFVVCVAGAGGGGGGGGVGGGGGGGGCVVVVFFPSIKIFPMLIFLTPTRASYSYSSVH